MQPGIFLAGRAEESGAHVFGFAVLAVNHVLIIFGSRVKIPIKIPAPGPMLLAPVNGSAMAVSAAAASEVGAGAFIPQILILLDKSTDPLPDGEKDPAVIKDAGVPNVAHNRAVAKAVQEWIDVKAASKEALAKRLYPNSGLSLEAKLRLLEQRLASGARGEIALDAELRAISKILNIDLSTLNGRVAVLLTQV